MGQSGTQTRLLNGARHQISEWTLGSGLNPYSQTPTRSVSARVNTCTPSNGALQFLKRYKNVKARQSTPGLSKFIIHGSSTGARAGKPPEMGMQQIQGNTVRSLGLLLGTPAPSQGSVLLSQ